MPILSRKPRRPESKKAKPERNFSYSHVIDLQHAIKVRNELESRLVVLNQEIQKLQKAIGDK